MPKGVRKVKKIIKITEKERAFCHAMPGCGFVKITAARKAGFVGGASNVSSTVDRILKKPQVRKYLDEIIEKHLKKLDLDGEKVIRQLTLIGTTTIKDLFNQNPETGELTMKTIEEIGDRCACIKKIKIHTKKSDEDISPIITTDIQLEMIDPVKPLELIGREFGKFQDSINHRFPEGVPVKKEVDLSKLSDKEIKTMLALQEKAKHV